MEKYSSSFVALSIAAFSSPAAFARPESHIQCMLGADSIYTDCALTKKTLTFPGREEGAYEKEYKLKSSYSCSTGRFLTGISITADNGSSAQRLTLGKTEVFTLTGMGPLILSDSDPALTKFMKSDSPCSLDFELLAIGPSPAQVNRWKDSTVNKSESLFDLISIYNDRTILVFWQERIEQNRPQFFPLLKSFRDSTQRASESSPGNQILRIRLRKLNEIIDGTANKNVDEEFDALKNDIHAALADLQDICSNLKAWKVDLPRQAIDATETARKSSEFPGEITCRS